MFLTPCVSGCRASLSIVNRDNYRDFELSLFQFWNQS